MQRLGELGAVRTAYWIGGWMGQRFHSDDVVALLILVGGSCRGVQHGLIEIE
jgi:hypothetical protein